MKSDKTPRIGVTMRFSDTPNYVESRDAIARDWGDFLSWSLPECIWMPIANTGVSAAQMAAAWGVNGLVLTGGDDIGVDPARDETEKALLEMAQQKDWPVFGVCRGLQLLCHVGGGQLTPCDEAEHVNTSHSIGFVQNVLGLGLKDVAISVNSYHSLGVRAQDVPPGFSVGAVADGAWAECIVDEPGRRVAVMWHPERERPYAEIDRAILRRLFLGVESGTDLAAR